MQEYGSNNTFLNERADKLRAQGSTVMYLAMDQETIAILAVADPMKPSTPQALEELRKKELRSICSQEIAKERQSQ